MINKIKSVDGEIKANKDNLVAIGTSTGGPKALQSIIPLIKKDINCSIVIVQHMPKGFTKSLSERLNTISNITVKEAEHGEIVKKGYCYIAPGDYHMSIIEKNKNIYINLSKEKPVSGHRPSVDVMMQSVAKLKDINKIGVILTGMGSDGAKGMKEIFESGGYTIAQNEETCVVYGMPKSAINIEVIKKILPLDQIASEIMNILGG
ncbi:chemotaxis response regulator protein-glutamate methylesterase 2 [Gottschalkia purinilytica]|uniref:protein-glutamate methylesterase n=1 Tax=Gottschalkia purinilytica TaxID=1503 RepID=A0A0L0WBT7_GOTPU|nr:CheB methylesterase domain-containing protein [Gottschalkia purinilytica]KNF08835.1 chemotaxis response regulator protein-glutamate methylesterase 2 [Gottschalkia purinilytica]